MSIGRCGALFLYKIANQSKPQHVQNRTEPNRTSFTPNITPNRIWCAIFGLVCKPKITPNKARQSYVSTKKRSHSHTYTSHKGHSRQGPGNHINIIICINKREAPIITGHTHKAGNQDSGITQGRQSGRQSGIICVTITIHRFATKERPHMIHQTEHKGQVRARKSYHHMYQ